jgi:hypothetical protein
MTRQADSIRKGKTSKYSADAQDRQNKNWRVEWVLIVSLLGICEQVQKARKIRKLARESNVTSKCSII